MVEAGRPNHSFKGMREARSGPTLRDLGKKERNKQNGEKDS